MTMENVGKFFTVMIFIVLGVLLSGFVLMKFWGWFIVPTFTMLPSLTFGQSIGILTFTTLFYRNKKSEKEFDFSESVGQWFESVVYTLLVFGIGWVIYLFIR